MASHSTRWRVSPVAWVPITLAIGAETVSNGLRAYALGTHLERFTVTLDGWPPLSVAGAVLVMAALAISLSQARAAWIALTPSGPARQRIVAGLAAVLLLVISISAMASHILEAQRAKVGDEKGSAGTYARMKQDYDKANAELDGLAKARSTTEIRTAMDGTRVKLSVWEATRQCTDADLLKGKVNYEACKPVLDLRQEMAQSIRKAELAPMVSDLSAKLAIAKPPVSEASATEAMVAMWWAWVMGVGVVFLATFGTVIFARVETVAPVSAANRVPVPATAAIPAPDAPPPGTRSHSDAESLSDIQQEVTAGRHHGVVEYGVRWGVGKAEASKRISSLEEAGEIICRRLGRHKLVVGIRPRLKAA